MEGDEVHQVGTASVCAVHGAHELARQGYPLNVMVTYRHPEGLSDAEGKRWIALQHARVGQALERADHAFIGLNVFKKRPGGRLHAHALMVTAMSDRESDIYHFWATAPEPDRHLLTRMMHDRAVAGGGTAWEKAADWLFVSARDLELPATAGRAARRAKLGLRFGEVEIRRPKSKSLRQLPKTVKLRLVEAVEIAPPGGTL